MGQRIEPGSVWTRQGVKGRYTRTVASDRVKIGKTTVPLANFIGKYGIDTVFYMQTGPDGKETTGQCSARALRAWGSKVEIIVTRID